MRSAKVASETMRRLDEPARNARCVFRSKRPANPVQFGQAFRCNSASASGPFRPGQWRAVACDDVRGIGECGYVVEGSDADVVLSLRREPPVSVMRCA
jgi:hypothetical protein